MAKTQDEFVHVASNRPGARVLTAGLLGGKNAILPAGSAEKPSVTAVRAPLWDAARKRPSIARAIERGELKVVDAEPTPRRAKVPSKLQSLLDGPAKTAVKHIEASENVALLRELLKNDPRPSVVKAAEDRLAELDVDVDGAAPASDEEEDGDPTHTAMPVDVDGNIDGEAFRDLHWMQARQAVEVCDDAEALAALFSEEERSSVRSAIETRLAELAEASEGDADAADAGTED